MLNHAETTPGRHRSPEPPAPDGSCWPDTSGTGVSTPPSTNGRSARSPPVPDAETSTISGGQKATSTTRRYAPSETGW
jgi:hypothetical protein